MKIVELQKKKKDLVNNLKTEKEVNPLVVAQLQEINYRICVSENISYYFFEAKKCEKKRDFKLMYKMFSKYVDTLASNFYLVSPDEKKRDEQNAACESFLAVLTGVSDRANNANFETAEEFFESFKMDSLSVNLAFNEFRNKFIEIK